MNAAPQPTLDDARTLAAAADQLLDQAVARASEITSGGKSIDDYQVLTERVAYAHTEARAARELIAAMDAAREAGQSSAELELCAAAGVGELVTTRVIAAQEYDLTAEPIK